MWSSMNLSLKKRTQPSRRTSRIARHLIQCPIPYTSDPNSIFSHWEWTLMNFRLSLPLLLTSGVVLSVSSWTDIGEPTSSTSQRPLPPAKQRYHKNLNHPNYNSLQTISWQQPACLKIPRILSLSLGMDGTYAGFQVITVVTRWRFKTLPSQSHRVNTDISFMLRMDLHFWFFSTETGEWDHAAGGYSWREIYRHVIRMWVWGGVWVFVWEFEAKKTKLNRVPISILDTGSEDPTEGKFSFPVVHGVHTTCNLK